MLATLTAGSLGASGSVGSETAGTAAITITAIASITSLGSDYMHIWWCWGSSGAFNMHIFTRIIMTVLAIGSICLREEIGKV